MILENQLIPYAASKIPKGPYLVIAPHPDDETLGMGGTIALAVEAGTDVYVVFVTSGDMGGDAATRQREAREAAKVLGVRRVYFLNLPDRKVHGEPLPEARLVEMIHSLKPATVFLPSFQEVHPDHRAVTQKFLSFLYGEYPKEHFPELWFYEINRQGEVCRLIDISSVIDRKEEAIDCYASQLEQLDYKSQCLCLDYARSISLGHEVQYAEGFWCHGAGETGSPESRYYRHLLQYTSHPQRVPPKGGGLHGESGGFGQLTDSLNSQVAAQEKKEDPILMHYFRLLLYYILKIPRYIRRTVELIMGHGVRGAAVRIWKKIGLFLQLKVWPSVEKIGLVSKEIPLDDTMVGAGAPGQEERIPVAPSETIPEHPHSTMATDQGVRSFDKDYRYEPDFCYADTVFEYQPLISVIVPVYNTDPAFLKATLDSVLNQQYPHWELCIADDCSTGTDIVSILEQYKSMHPEKIKICYRKKNGHISQATNSALQLARGEFIALLDHDDLLTEDAFSETVALLNQYPEADMIYSDEDKVDSKGVFSEPFYKPDWSPENLHGQMYTCHLSVYRTELVRKLGGMRVGYEGAQDHDLALRVSEVTDNIYHISKVLYHWRKAVGSTAESPSEKEYASDAGLLAVNDALERKGEGGWAESVPDIPGCYLVHYKLREQAKISIVILTRDKAELLDRCLSSIHGKTAYDNYEIIVVDNGSTEQATFDCFEKWSDIYKEAMKIIRHDVDFNYPHLNNVAVEHASGDLLLLLNNDTEVLSSGWLREMAGYALQKQMGAVGSCLLYPDHTIQHAGIILGITGAPGTPGVAGHAHKYFREGEPGYFSRLKFVADYSAVTGACLMVTKEKYHEVGGLDNTLSVAFNDVDFCLKLGAKGYRNVLLPHVRLIHHESKSRGYEDTPEKQKRFANEVSIMLDRYTLDVDRNYNKNLTLWSEDFQIKGAKESELCLKN